MFTYHEVGVLVRHWFEIDLTDSHLEHGARVELRVADPQPHRGSESAAQQIRLDQPLWRADLFDRLDGEPGAYDAAHFHPYFHGVEPCERKWNNAIQADPWSWLRRQLCEIDRIADTAGIRLGDPVAEAGRVCADADAIVAAAQGRAPTQCRSKEQCHAWASDVTHAVDLMLGSLQQPQLLDRDRVSPWLARG